MRFAPAAQRSAVLQGSLARELAARAAAIGGLCEWEEGALQFGGGEAPTDPRLQLLQGAAVATWPAAEFVTGDLTLLDAVRAQVAPGPGGVLVALQGTLACARVIEVPARLAEGEEPAEAAFTVLVVTSGSTATIATDLAELRKNLIWVGGGVLVLAGAIAVWLSRRIVGPVAALATAATRIRAGQRQPMPRGGSREIDDLASALDGALTRLDDARERQSRFAADASHELRTPIAIVRTQAEVLQLGAFDAERCRLGLAVVVDAAARMAATVESLLLLARADAGAFAALLEPCDLVAIVRAEAVACRELAAERACSITVEAPLAGRMRGEAGLLRMLVGNLLGNAIEHSLRAGEIRVEVVVGTSVSLAVIDHGEGIAAEAIPRVFERFFRADASRSRATGGAGLGLALVQSIADLHGARCSIESELGVGTTVNVVFPAG